LLKDLKKIIREIFDSKVLGQDILFQRVPQTAEYYFKKMILNLFFIIYYLS